MIELLRFSRTVATVSGRRYEQVIQTPTLRIRQRATAYDTMTSILLQRQAQARGRSMSVVTTFLIYTMLVVVLFVNADEGATGMHDALDDHHAATNANAHEEIQATGEKQIDPCEERIQKEVWETFTSQIDSVTQSLEASNQRVQEAEHAHTEMQRSLTATVDELQGKLSSVEEQSATCQAKLDESDIQETFLSNNILKWKNRYEEKQRRFVSVESERNKFKKLVQKLEGQLALAQEEALQQERATTEQVQAARDEVTETMSKRHEHLQARNEKLTAERKEVTDDLKSHKDHLESTKDRLFHVRQELFRANEKIRDFEKQQNALRDYWLGWYEMIQPVVDGLIHLAQPIGRLLSDQFTYLTNMLLLQATALGKVFLRSGWPHISHFCTVTTETIAPLWARAVTGAPVMAYASTMQGQLVDRLGLLADTLFTYLVLQEGTPRLISATRFLKEHPETTVVYIEVAVATLLMALAVRLWFLLSRPASKKSTESRAKAKTKVSPAKTKSKVGRSLKKKLS
jgi:predicted nuclease with TOPRIM domain